MTPSQPDSEDQLRADVIVVGTGMGGSTAGFELARRGHRVLFIEKGPFVHARLEAAPGALRDRIVHPPGQRGPAAAPARNPRFDQGWWPDRVALRTPQGTTEIDLPIGCGSGGSTAFYAATLERFAPEDFRPRSNFPHVADSSLPESWPVDYQALEPYYERAERLYRVRGTLDPLFTGGNSVLLDPVPLNPRDAHFVDLFTRAGLHPYRVHAGYDVIDGCRGCQDGHCPKACKRDAAWTCLIPALVDHGARILPECEVVKLEADAHSVTGVVCEHEGRTFTARADVVVLAAGAFSTPAVLLRSRSAAWPAGLANGSDQVGRNLMFHAGDFFAIRPDRALDGGGTQKTLAINDFYAADGQKLGTFQTLGVSLDVGSIMQYLRDSASTHPTWWSWIFSPRPIWWRKLTSPFIRIGVTLAYRALRFKDAAIWASILEDLPYPANRVTLDERDERRIRIEYEYSGELKSRVEHFRALLQQALGRRLMVLSPENKIDYPHVCGTCRAGADPATSVVDAENRAHAVDNLFVVDASFFPSSAGTNPSLTIAANAIRVAEIISQDLAALRSDSADVAAQ